MILFIVRISFSRFIKKIYIYTYIYKIHKLRFHSSKFFFVIVVMTKHKLANKSLEFLFLFVCFLLGVGHFFLSSSLCGDQVVVVD